MARDKLNYNLKVLYSSKSRGLWKSDARTASQKVGLSKAIQQLKVKVKAVRFTRAAKYSYLEKKNA
jgi:hypothetical protein